MAMLARRDGETLAQFLARLDRAIGKAPTDNIFTDVVNPPSKQSTPIHLTRLRPQIGLWTLPRQDGEGSTLTPWSRGVVVQQTSVA